MVEAHEKAPSVDTSGRRTLPSRVNGNSRGAWRPSRAGSAPGSSRAPESPPLPAARREAYRTGSGERGSFEEVIGFRTEYVLSGEEGG